jgi:hypothetical protein
MNQSNEHQHKHEKKPRPIHKDWRIWTAVALILAAMVSYVLTNDEVLRPARVAPPSGPAGPVK